jgi:hypothetical protein
MDSVMIVFSVGWRVELLMVLLSAMGRKLPATVSYWIHVGWEAHGLTTGGLPSAVLF